MKKNGITASSVKGFLTILLVIIILAAIGGFYLGLQELQKFAVDVSHTVSDADASGKNIGKLKELKKALAQRETLVAKADKIFTTEASYQSQALTDVQRYAGLYGLTISNTNFNAQATDDPLAAPNSHTFIISLQGPVSYAKLLQFLSAIEGNLPKMQISSITLNRTANGGADEVTTGDIKLTISTR